jgi:hypothetical protein
MSYPQIGVEVRHACPKPPYNSLNFTSANSTIYNELVSFANNAPLYPLDPGADKKEVSEYRMGITTFASMNQKTIQFKQLNQSTLAGNIPYPTFSSESERMKYNHGRLMTAARNRMTGQNPSLPAGVPYSTIYQIQQSGS